MSDRDELARRIHRAAHLTGEFQLRSGAVSDEYFDKYRFEADPTLLAEIAVALATLVRDDVDAVAGLELGGVPLATAVSLETGIPARFVRKEPKAYGTRRLAEGGEIDGLRLTVIEDVVTSGGQLITSCGDLSERGADVVRAVCVIDRGAGGEEAVRAAGFELRSLYTADDLRAAAG